MNQSITLFIVHGTHEVSSHWLGAYSYGSFGNQHNLQIS